MPVEAELGGIGEERPELHEEGAEVRVEAVKVEVVRQRRGAHQPGICLAGHGVHPLLGPIDLGLLLGAADEEDGVGPVVAGQVSLGDVVFALALLEVDQVEVTFFDEAMDGAHEVLGDRVHEGTRDEGHPPVALEESHHPGGVDQFWLVDVQIHPVNAVQLVDHMVGEDFGHRFG